MRSTTPPTSATSLPCRTWSWSPSKTPTPVLSRNERPRWGAHQLSRTTERCWRQPVLTSCWRSGDTGRWPASPTTCSIRAIPSSWKSRWGSTRPRWAIAAKAARLNAFVAVPLAQRYAPFATRARELLAAGRFGPLSHIYVRINRPGPARYPAWDCAWMLDPAEAGGGCLRNLGPHGLDMFLHLTGEEAQVTGAQLSHRAHEHPVEDYASVILRSASGILGTVEVGNGFPRDGTDGEWKIAGRDAILTMKDGIMKLVTADGDETLPGANVTAPVFTTVRDALDHWRRGAAPPISVHDCARVVRLIDQAYERAG